jgi:hypothetical protein
MRVSRNGETRHHPSANRNLWRHQCDSFLATGLVTLRPCQLCSEGTRPCGCVFRENLYVNQISRGPYWHSSGHWAPTARQGASPQNGSWGDRKNKGVLPHQAVAGGAVVEEDGATGEMMPDNQFRLAPKCTRGPASKPVLSRNFGVALQITSRFRSEP